jgi:hypothetical protein
MYQGALAGAVLLSAAASGCGEFVRESRSPSQLVILSLQGASGAEPDELGSTVTSDVVTFVTTPAPCSETAPCATVYGDPGAVTLRLQLRDLGASGVGVTPSSLNEVTVNRYRVVYTRTDGRNTPGVDVPYPFDSAVTFTVPAEGSVTHGFDLVRNNAKREAPLAALQNNVGLLSTIAEVTFYGRDQAGNDVAVSGQIGVTFGNFADPE